MAREFDNANMEAFYASLDAENTLPNNESVRTRSSEETQKAMKILRDFVSKKFSLLLHPGRFRLMKDTLKYLLSLPPDEGFSMRTKSLILQLSQSFAQWSLDYDSASLKLESATVDLSEAEKVNSDFDANVKEFQEMEMKEERLCKQLTYLREEKRDLEEKINAKKVEIVNVTEVRHIVAKRKIEVIHKGRVMKARRDGLRNQVPRLKVEVEEESAQIIIAKIEGEWSKLAKQFIDSISF